MAFHSEDTLSKWMRAIMVATMTDEELMASARGMSESIDKVEKAFEQDLQPRKAKTVMFKN